MQKRRPKFRRHENPSRNLVITDRDLEILGVAARYHFVTTSTLLCLVPGNDKVTQRRLRNLYDAAYVNRFTLPTTGSPPGEFIYFLDQQKSLELLVGKAQVPTEDLDWKRIRYNREKAYAELQGSVGRFLFVEHELKISRFHAMLELACRQSEGKCELAGFRQGPELWSRVEVPKVSYDPRQDAWYETEDTERLPHRPDAFFTLRFPGEPEGQQLAHFFYEADRGNSDPPRFRQKLRAHFHYVVRKRAHQDKYGIKRIRAVLVETEKKEWAMHLRETARHPLVSGNNPTRLFWFAPSEILGGKSGQGRAGKGTHRFLAEPSRVFRPVWLTPVDDALQSLLD